MRSFDLVPGCAGLGVALGVGWGALGMPMGTLGQPGAGFLPFWVAAALGVMSAILIVRSLRAPPDAPGDTADELDRRGTVGALAGLVLYSCSSSR